MSHITKIIGQQAFEQIHTRIGAILADELASQAAMSYDDDLVLDIYKERDVPFNTSELPAINVMMEDGEFDMQTLVQHDGIYNYAIEVIANAKSNDDAMGDTHAMNKVQKIIGKCRAILMNPKYTTLGFAPPFIKNRKVTKIYFGKPVRQDSDHTVMGRIIIQVSVVENTNLEDYPLIQGMDTGVRLYETDKGYLYITYYY